MSTQRLPCNHILVNLAFGYLVISLLTLYLKLHFGEKFPSALEAWI